MRSQPETVAFRLTPELKQDLRAIARRRKLSINEVLSLIVVGSYWLPPAEWHPGTFVTFGAYGVPAIGCIEERFRKRVDIRYQTLSDMRAWAHDDFGDIVPSRITSRSIEDLDQWTRPVPWWWIRHEIAEARRENHG
jgi:hypothetical protein